MADPRLMVSFALNQLDRQNYEKGQVKDEAGNDVTYYQYISPAAESRIWHRSKRGPPPKWPEQICAAKLARHWRNQRNQLPIW
jgi:hypothetical protein